MSFPDLGKTVGSAVLKRVGRATSRVQEETPLAADLLEREDAFLVVFDAPGATAGDTRVDVTERTVRVRIDRFRESREGYEMRFPGRGLELDGTVTLPKGAAVDADAASAELRSNGTLHVRVPKVDADES